MSTLLRAAVPVLALVLGGCTKGRDLSLCASLGGSQSPDCGQGNGQHPVGWADKSSPSFHQKWLRTNGDKLSDCQTCHGSDYGGGAVGVACTTSGCHTKKGGPEFCGTCHGGDAGPMPSTGAHALHASFCNDCHDVPKSVAQADHITGEVKVVFSGLALPSGKTPAYDATARTCANVYCHVGQTPKWEAPPATIGCDLCHQTPPDSHKAWARVATPPAGASPAAVAATCGACHLVPTPGAQPAPGDTHVNGKTDFAATIACNTCHGQDATGAPPVSLDGSTDPSARGVGQHRAHLDENLPGRIGHAVACATCHAVPASVTQPGHLDHPLPATVSLPQKGTYDPVTQSCTVWCHWDGNSGKTPTWTDTTGDIVSGTCTGCHGFPPLTLRDGTPHTHAPPVLSACQKCHPFSVATHVDGIVEILP